MKIEIEHQKVFDDIIIGGGGSGLAAAIKLASVGRRVVVLSKNPPLLSATSAAQGGINANFGNQLQDNWRWHMYDTIKASDWLGDQDVIEILCLKANKSVEFLHNIGVEFDLDEHGKILQKIYGGQTTNYGSNTLARRACSVLDRTGNAIISKLFIEAKKSGVEFISYQYAVELIHHDHECFGVKVFDLSCGNFVSYIAKNTIIASGGYSRVFKSSTAPRSVTGDGLKLVSNMGIALKDMEFVQFHPTALQGNGILISETARSIGGYLLNSSKERFMNKYSNYEELSPRDIVSRAIFKESQGLCNPTYLDLTHIDPALITKKLYYTNQVCKSFLGLEMTKDLVPIIPSAHYCMGGIPTNKYCQVIKNIGDHQYTIEGLYAIGEAACHSVHGAGRLGCNSLLELIVFAHECADHIIHSDSNKKFSDLIDYKNITLSAYSDDATCDLNGLALELQTICDKEIGIIRESSALEEAISQIERIHLNLKNSSMGFTKTKWNLDFVNYTEVESMIICAKHMAYSARARKETRGSHYRSDYPDRNDQQFCKHSFSLIEQDGGVIEYCDVSTKTTEIGFFAPELRKY